MSQEAPIWNVDLIKQYDLSGPRYTSYPTAPQFSTDFTTRDLHNAIERSNRSLRPLSLYFHIPFCDTVCYYCACNKVITADKSRAQPYLQYLAKELALHAQNIDTSRPVKQLHWGGGTPTYLSDEQMRSLMNETRRHFLLLDENEGQGGEYSIEVHPGRCGMDTLLTLREIGFNRLSMGVQDFHPEVQAAVNRFNSYEEVDELTSTARALGFKSISMDLIYGLPLQTIDGLMETLDQVITLSPDRLSLFNYAHMPHLFKVQKQIDESQLPSPHAKLQMLELAIKKLQLAGYIYIGMDHFAKPNDELAIAQKEGKLQRNFQGYSTHNDCDLFAFGVSSISSIDNVYVQNHKTLDEYYQALDGHSLPTAKGFILNHDDQLRQQVITQLICNFELFFSQIEQQFGISFTGYFAEELRQLQPMVDDGLLDIDGDRIHVKPSGRLLIRRICMTFDAYLNRQQATPDSEKIRYSKII